MNPDILREKNKVAFDTMVMVDMIESEENVKMIINEWQNFLEKTEFLIPDIVIKETYGILVGKKHMDITDARDGIDKIKKLFNMKELKYRKDVDNKESIRLFKEAANKFIEAGFKNTDHLVSDSRIIAIMKREGINIVYSREELFRKTAELAGLEARNFIKDSFRKKSQ